MSPYAKPLKRNSRRGFTVNSSTTDAPARVAATLTRVVAIPTRVAVKAVAKAAAVDTKVVAVNTKVVAVDTKAVAKVAVEDTVRNR